MSDVWILSVPAQWLLLGLGVLLGVLGCYLFTRRGIAANAVRLAVAQAQEMSLRERLDEAHSVLVTKEEALLAALQKSSETDKQLVSLQATHHEKLAAYEELKQAFEHTREQLKTEFQNLAGQIFDEKGKSFTQANQNSLDALLTPFREQIRDFQQRVNQVHDESLKGNTRLGAEIRQVLEIGLKMSAQAGSLAGALRGEKKTLGNWGEIQLERSLQLAGLMLGDHYEPQARFKDEAGNDRQPDFVLKLPDGKHIVIDSKVSLVDYDRAVNAEDEEQAQLALAAHVKAVRHHIDDLSRKDYSNLIGMRSPSFVFMFMPIEPAFMAALRHERGLFDYGYQRNVVLVSHTTLMPVLQTVANLWRIASSNEQAHELSQMAGEIHNHVVTVAHNLKKLGDSLAAVSNHYNRTVVSLAGQRGLYGKTVRFGELSTRANQTMAVIEPLVTDLETQRLELVMASGRPDSQSDRSCDRALDEAQGKDKKDEPDNTAHLP